MKQIQVNLDVRSYPIVIGQNLMSCGEHFARFLQDKKILIVTNETVARI